MASRVSELHHSQIIDTRREAGIIADRPRATNRKRSAHSFCRTAPKNDVDQMQAELFRKHSMQLYRKAYALLRNREDAEDAVQNSWLSVMANLDSFQGRSSISTWLTRIVINSALMILRKKRRGKEFSLDTTDHGLEVDMMPWVRSDCANPEEEFLDTEKTRVVNQAVSRLRPRLRAVLDLAQFKEMTIKDTAKSLGISTPAAKGRLFHARAALRNSTAMRAVARWPAATGRSGAKQP